MRLKPSSLKLGSVWILLFPLFNFAQSPLFRELSSSSTSISFANTLTESKFQNVFVDYNFYSGGGLAVGDLDNDGLPDLYFTGNQVENQLYKNLGGMKFKAMTATSGTGDASDWCTGVTLADVNGDGLLDIYVCKAGQFKESSRLKNKLYINQGNFKFTEEAEAYGIADAGRSVQATFFDFDRDNDLDLYVVNRPYDYNLPLDQRVANERNPNSYETDRLYRNDGGTFTDVTVQAGVKNWAFGLNVIASDLNGDGFVDLFVSNDYSEPDNYWINQGNGTFRMAQNGSFLHISNFSMGSDLGDFNNDGHRDIVVVDMMAKDNRRKKTNMSGMNPEAFWDNVSKGRHFQYMQNVLQVNNGNGTFSDIAELAGVSTTEWSWAPLLADFDNDGYEDLFVSNGIRREIRYNDWAKKLVGKPLQEIVDNFRKYTDGFPSEPTPNFCYRNQGDLSFEDVSQSWGLDLKGFSTGAAIADLDLDGDLDLVLNNVDAPATIYQNESSGTKSLRVKAAGPEGNRFGLNLKAVLKTQSGMQSRELTLTRGYESSSEPVMHFGLKAGDEMTSLTVTWPDGKIQTLTGIDPQKMLIVEYKDASISNQEKAESKTIFRSHERQSRLDFVHRERDFDDFDREVLLPHRYSQMGPMLAKADVNGDGWEDLFVGGASGQAGIIYLQFPGGRFMPTKQAGLRYDVQHEDIGAVFTDVNKDGFPDLIVVSGSNEKPDGSALYRHRLYMNDRKGIFRKDTTRLPKLIFSGSRIRAADMDGDGDEDIFIGGRVVPGAYPRPASSVLLKNEGGRFVDVTKELAPDFQNLGMVTDARWVDLDQDQDLDLMVVGEWMTPEWFKNEGGKLIRSTKGSGLETKTGWWYSLNTADMDGDGDMDLVAGNLGLNAKYQATETEPFEVYAGDMDKNGSLDIILGYNVKGETFPVRGRQCSSEQVPEILEKFPTYEAFGQASLVDIYGDALNQSLHYKANSMASAYIENLGNGKFKYHNLPNEAQLSTANAILIDDFTGNGHPDLLVAGNLYMAEVETARHDASIGTLLEGNGKGQFKAVPVERSGFFAPGDVKDMIQLSDHSGIPIIVVARNNMPMRVFMKR